MTTPTPLQFWFEFASTYSYPAAARIESAAQAAGCPLEWRPFLLGPIFASQGWNDSPFNLYPAKGRYMWRDLARVCAKLDLPLRRPSTFPRNGLHAARVALLGAREPWGPEFVRAVYGANFVDDRDIGDPEVVRSLLAAAGLEADRIADLASAPANKAALRQQTEEAVRLGIFGAPTFVVGEEMFWGNDRLEDAIVHWRERGVR